MKPLTHHDIVLRPLVTEKSLAQSERQNTYTFKVRESANKVQIRDAIEHIFKVRVVDVRTQIHMGKRRRVGRWLGHTGSWKKAIVRVKEGDTIDFY
ncbi:MAG: 50S ribosomal protein L23 [Planctomycetota bacterium]|jgi:large subunit ribosomal protein L23